VILPVLAVLALLATAGCRDPEALREANRLYAAPGPTPGLVPLDPVLAQADIHSLSAETGDDLSARGEALRRRADAIRTDAEAAASQ
jgi:hypothetical protein